MIVRYLKIAGALALIGSTMGIATSSQAHHAFAAEFDARRPVKIEGVVTKVRFVNPHSWLYVDVKNKEGETTNWGFEFGTPNTLKNNGIGRADVHPGTPVAIEGYMAKNGGAFGYSQAVTLPDGRKVRTGSAPDAPPEIVKASR